MKINRPQTPSSEGFTLLELLVVIAIIAILAALTMGGFKFANEAAARNRTIASHAVIKSGLELYKEKNGEYPEAATPDETIDVGGTSVKSGGARMLYQAISGDGDSAIKLKAGTGSDSNGVISPEESEFAINAGLPKNMIGGSRDKSGNLLENGYLVDGWYRPFQYEKGGTANAINPTYDLWSFGKLEGNSNPVYDAETRRNAEVTASWIKNW